MRLLSRVEARLGRRLPLASLFAAPTVEELAQLLRREAVPTTVGAVVPIHPGGSRQPLFCVHPIGGHVFAYAELARALGPDQPVYGLQAAGLEGSEPPRGDVAAMATAYLRDLREVQPQGPYQLLGWSFGGLVALEMARQLSEAGERVGLVTLVDTHLPLAEAPSLSDAEVAAGFLADLAATQGVSLPPLDLAPGDTASSLLPRLVAQARRAGVVPPDLDAAALERHLAVYRAHLQTFCHYQPRPYGGPVLLLHAGDTEPPGWRALLRQVQIVALPGDHFALLQAPLAGDVAARWQEAAAAS